MDTRVYIGHRVGRTGVARWFDRPSALQYPTGLGHDHDSALHDWGSSASDEGRESLARAILTNACNDAGAATDADLVREFASEFVSRWQWVSFSVEWLTIRRWMRGRLFEMEEESSG